MDRVDITKLGRKEGSSDEQFTSLSKNHKLISIRQLVIGLTSLTQGQQGSFGSCKWDGKYPDQTRRREALLNSIQNRWLVAI